jgi:DNA-binding MarR family transcriptional regulator
VSERSTAVDAWEALYRAQVAVLRQLLSEFPHDEVSFTEYDVLFNLYRQPGHRLRIRDLNRHLLLTQPSVSRLLDRLAARGLVRKSSDPSDARGTIVTLTESGVDVFRRIGSQHGESIANRMSVLDADELHELARLSDKLRAGAAPS